MARSGDFSPNRSRRTSRSVRSNVVGTHTGISLPRARRMNAESVGFSDPRKRKRATKGYVDSVLDAGTPPPPKRGGRVGARRFDLEVHRKRRVRSVVVAALCLLVAVGVAAAVGVAVLLGSIDSALALKDSNATSALKAAPRDDSFYALVLADFSLPSDEPPVSSRGLRGADDLSLDVSDTTLEGFSNPSASSGSSVSIGSSDQARAADAFALVRVDTVQRTAQLLAVPSNVTVPFDDGLYYTLSDVWAQKGDAGVVEAVSDLTGVPITHVVKADGEGLAGLVDAVGGISVEVAEEIDDPAAGSVYLAEGSQDIDGQGALTMVRATNLSGGTARMAQNRLEVLKGLSCKLVNLSPFDFFSLADRMPGALRTDMGTGGVNHLLSAMNGVTGESVTLSTVPGDEITRDGIVVYRVYGDELADDVKRMGQGLPPEADEAPPAVDPSSFSLFIKNGSGITGAAASISGSLEERGFDVEGIGNTEIEAYDETLVVYASDEHEAAARTVLQELGVGRVVSDYPGYYDFDTDVLLIVGRDWKPSE